MTKLNTRNRLYKMKMKRLGGEVLTDERGLVLRRLTKYK